MKRRRFAFYCLFSITLLFFQTGCSALDNVLRPVLNPVAELVFRTTANRLARKMVEESGERIIRETVKDAAGELAEEAVREAAESVVERGARTMAPEIGEELLELSSKRTDEVINAALRPLDVAPIEIDEIRPMAISRADVEQHLADSDYRALARDLVDPSSGADELLADIVRGLDDIDNLIERGSAADLDAALNQLNTLRVLQGDGPEFTLREGIIRIRQEELGELVGTLNGSRNLTIADRDAFFEEALPRLAADSLEDQGTRQQIRHVARVLDWKDHLARSGIEGEVKTAIDDGRLLLMYGLDDALQDAQTEPKIDSRAIFYTEDAPGIYNLEYDVPTNATLEQLIEGELPPDVKLPPPGQGIHHFRPDLIYTGSFDDVETYVRSPLRPAAPTPPVEDLLEPLYRPYVENEVDDQEQAENVYFLSKVDSDQ